MGAGADFNRKESMEGRIQGAVFDKDGTLFDFDATWGGWAFGLFSDLAGGDMAEASRLGDALGFDMRARRFAPDSPIIAGSSGEIADILAPLLPAKWTRESFLEHAGRTAKMAPVAEITPLKPLLSSLSGMGMRLGVATNDSEATALSQISRASLDGAFDFVAGYDSGFGAKPGPGMLGAFCEATGLDPGGCAMVGDSLHDIQAGRAAGMRTVLVLTGPGDQDEARREADFTIPDISHLPALFESGIYKVPGLV